VSHHGSHKRGPPSACVNRNTADVIYGIDVSRLELCSCVQKKLSTLDVPKSC
jgi:hypothetical protein